MNGVKHQSIKELVYEDILNDIIQGVYPANDILNERMLVEKYGVSKTPVREALVQLCGEGILRNIPRCGYQLPVITPAEINDMIEYRVAIETGALKKAMRIISPEQIDRLMIHVRQAGELTKKHDIMENWTIHMEFHLLLCECAENRFMYRSLQDALRFCSRSVNQYFSKSPENGLPAAVSGHVRIMEAIRGGNGELAERLLIEDVNCLWDGIKFRI